MIYDICNVYSVYWYYTLIWYDIILSRHNLKYKHVWLMGTTWSKDTLATIILVWCLLSMSLPQVYGVVWWTWIKKNASTVESQKTIWIPQRRSDTTCCSHGSRGAHTRLVPSRFSTFWPDHDRHATPCKTTWDKPRWCPSWVSRWVSSSQWHPSSPFFFPSLWRASLPSWPADAPLPSYSS